MTVLTPDTGAAVEPLAVIQEGQIAGAAVRVPLDCVDLWEAKTEETSNPCMQQEQRQPNVMAVNRAELKYLICFLSDLYNQTHGQNRG